MHKRVDAIYENDVLRPLEPMDLPEHQRVSITMADVTPSEEEWLDLEYERWAASEIRGDISLEAVRQALAKIPGSATSDSIAERTER
jgi:predicted DNA-binding antitoxin AbrB/MazE fold protein